jgi:succinyl-CoA synthetase beta subunit
MGLLEYQGKQPCRKHAVPAPEGRHAATVPEAAADDDELGYAGVIKASLGHTQEVARLESGEP